ncbi:MAG: class I SAM-dependent methyltransferase, partial [Phycisphaerae bacterium]
VRNFQNLSAGIHEMGRVCKPGARLAILEFANPNNPMLRAVFQAYCEIVLPRIGVLISRDSTGAYRYLPKSISSFETRAGMEAIIRNAGFERVTSKGMNLGGVILYTGIRTAS